MPVPYDEITFSSSSIKAGYVKYLAKFLKLKSNNHGFRINGFLCFRRYFVTFINCRSHYMWKRGLDDRVHATALEVTSAIADDRT